MKKLLMIVNPYAGRQAAQSSLFSVIERCDAAGYNVEVHPTRGRAAVIDLVKTRANEFDLIVCCGGDGTLNEVVTGLMATETRPPLGYIPMGTTNDFATTLGIPKMPVEAAERMLKGGDYPFDVGVFNDRYFTYVAAFGAFTEVSYQTPQPLKNVLGHAAYLLEGAKRIPDIKPQRVRIEHDNGVLEDDYIFGSISNSTSVAGLIKLKGNKVSLQDGKFELMLIKNPHDITKLTNIVTSLITQDFDEKSDKYVKFIHTSKAIIDTPYGMTWTTDGEDGGRQTHVEIGIRPLAITLKN